MWLAVQTSFVFLYLCNTYMYFYRSAKEGKENREGKKTQKPKLEKAKRGIEPILERAMERRFRFRICWLIQLVPGPARFSPYSFLRTE